MTTTNFSSHYWRRSLTHSMPVAMGYIPAGIAFAVLFVAAGLPAWAAIFSSIILYAGAAQYASIPLLASGTGFMTLASNTLAINLRHAFYATPLLNQLPTKKLARIYCLFALTDETFSVLTTLDEKTRGELITGISLLCQSYWVLGTVLGVLVGAGLNDLVPHLDFALVCLFAILAYEQFRAVQRFYPIIIAIIAFVLAMWLVPSLLLLTAIVVSIGLIIVHFFLTPTTANKNP